MVAQAQAKRSSKKAKQIILAAAIFDAENKVLVKGDGLLPTKKITDAYVEQVCFSCVFRFTLAKRLKELRRRVRHLPSCFPMDV